MDKTIEKTRNHRELSADGDAEAWLSVLELCGEQLRENAGRDKADDPVEKRVCSRSYTLKQAARLAGVNPATLRQAATVLALDSFLDPRGKLRFPVYSFKPTAADPDLNEMIAGYERLNPEDLATALGVDRRRLRRQLSEAGISPKGMTWRDVRGVWRLPEPSRSSMRSWRPRPTINRRARRNENAAAARGGGAGRKPGKSCATG